MGAIGIGRAFTYGGAKGREEGMAGTIDHFRDKLVNLEAKMKTEEGKRLAFVRSQRLKIFGRWWQEEMGLARAETGDMAWVQEVPPWVENAVFKEARPGEGSIPVHASGSRLPSSGRYPAESKSIARSLRVFWPATQNIYQITEYENDPRHINPLVGSRSLSCFQVLTASPGKGLPSGLPSLL